MNEDQMYEAAEREMDILRDEIETLRGTHISSDRELHPVGTSAELEALQAENAVLRGQAANHAAELEALREQIETWQNIAGRHMDASMMRDMWAQAWKRAAKMNKESGDGLELRWWACHEARAELQAAFDDRTAEYHAARQCAQVWKAKAKQKREWCGWQAETISTMIMQQVTPGYLPKSTREAVTERDNARAAANNATEAANVAFAMRDLALAKAEGYLRSRNNWKECWQKRAKQTIELRRENTQLLDGIDEVCMMLQDYEHTTDYTARHAASGLLSSLVSPYLYDLPFSDDTESEHAPDGLTPLSASSAESAAITPPDDNKE